jgi:hypothetical protein
MRNFTDTSQIDSETTNLKIELRLSDDRKTILDDFIKTIVGFIGLVTAFAP